MSAYMMSPNEIGQLAAFVAFCHGEVDPDRTPEGKPVILGWKEAATLLAAANAESVGYRYRMHVDEAAQMAGVPTFDYFVGLSVAEAETAARNSGHRIAVGEAPYDHGHMAKLLGSFTYQSCEAPGWPDSRVARWCDRCERIAE